MKCVHSFMFYWEYTLIYFSEHKLNIIYTQLTFVVLNHIKFQFYRNLIILDLDLECSRVGASFCRGLPPFK